MFHLGRSIYPTYSVADELELNNSLDLNYRVDLPDEEVRQLIAKDRNTRNYNVRDMLSNDQVSLRI